MLPLIPSDLAHDMDGAITALGVIEYMCDPGAFLRGLLDYRRTVVISYAPAEQRIEPGTPLGVRSNALTEGEWEELLKSVGLSERPWRQARVLAGGFVNLVYYF